MWWTWIIAGIVVFGAAAAAVSAARSLRRRRRQYADAARLWRDTPADRRLEALGVLLSSREQNGPAWYLIGVEHLRAGDPREAARAFGMAHHADCDLESAALLAFACLKAAPGPGSDVVEQILATWREMKQPPLPAYEAERRLLACLEDATAPPQDLPPPGRLAWLVLGSELRPNVERVFSQR